MDIQWISVKALVMTLNWVLRREGYGAVSSLPWHDAGDVWAFASWGEWEVTANG